jgi:hypothetical protein
VTFEISEDVRTYLSAVGALAVFVAEQDKVPVRVGFLHDPSKALAYMVRKWPHVSFAWMAWFDANTSAGASFISEISGRSAELIYMRRDQTRIPRRIPWVINYIETLALREQVVLTPHAIAINRAKFYARRLDAVLTTLQHNGTFSAFNRAYRIYRDSQRMSGESAVPFWAAKEQLRKVLIRYLVAHKDVDFYELLAEISAKFPWFNSSGRAHSRKPMPTSN